MIRPRRVRADTIYWTVKALRSVISLFISYLVPGICFTSKSSVDRLGSLIKTQAKFKTSATSKPVVYNIYKYIYIPGIYIRYIYLVCTWLEWCKECAKKQLPPIFTYTSDNLRDMNTKTNNNTGVNEIDKATLVAKTAVPFWGRTSQILSSLPPQTGLQSKKGYNLSFTPNSSFFPEKTLWKFSPKHTHSHGQLLHTEKKTDVYVCGRWKKTITANNECILLISIIQTIKIK